MAVATITNLHDRTDEDASTGAVRSIQAADLQLPGATLRELWLPANLERLARTYWRFLTRVTLGLVRVRYSPAERSLVLLASPLKLLTFAAPEYEMDARHGLVRWRIERGLLVARRGRGGRGYLQIDVRRLDAPDAPGASHRNEERAEDPALHLHVEVEVAGFYPAIASGLGRRFYGLTQSRIHVLITRGFLRSLARLDLAESRVGALTGTAGAPGAAP
ncbi:MAG TPA: hypothetical protein VEJ23_00750 [Solirubrobacteraceae bacterium]|nr:hypothetical protein [Solirubrobacteraceae bacterium]